jgi:hypothetical protein
MANSTFSAVSGYDGVGKPLDLFGHRRSTTRLVRVRVRFRVRVRVRV